MTQHLASEPHTAATTILRAYAKLPAQDVERARSFYREKLDLTPFAERHSHLHYEVGGANFIVFPSTGRASGTHDQLGLVVENLEAEVGRLKSRGITFEEFPPPPGATVTDGIMDAGFIKAAWFKDSEGNLVSIAQFAFGPLAP